jgi:pimeloyl-ACP methyl ester carboxylesterase
MAEDVAAFLRELAIEKPVLYGFSDGGIIGLLLAINYPEKLAKLIISGANVHPGGIKTIYRDLMKVGYFFTRSQKYKLMLTQPHISEVDLGNIVTPTLVLAGSRDIIKDEHTKTIARNIRGSELKILEGESHTSYVIHSAKLFKIIQPFLGVAPY